MSRRVFYISPGIELGGGEVSLLTLIRHLDPARYEPVVCVYGPGAFADSIRALSCEYHIVQYRGLLSQAGFIGNLAGLIHRSGASIVHVNTLDIRAGLAARLARRPLLGHLRVIFPTTWVDRAFVRLANRTISVSNAARDHFCQTRKTPPGRFATIYNPVDIAPAEHAHTDIRRELGLTEQTFLVGAIGRIDPWKGLETFIDAATILHMERPDMHCLIAGAPGPATEEKRYAQELHARVRAQRLSSVFHFLGYRADALAIIAQLDALVVPSRILQTPGGIKTEGFGRVAAEGLAMRTAVIASHVGGLPEIITDGKTGLLFEPSDARSLASAMRNLLNNLPLRQALITDGHARFLAEFSVSKHLERVQHLYDQLTIGCRHET